MSLFAELKRRNVFRVGIAYVITAWLILQVADIVLDNISAPEWLMKGIMLVLVIGLPLALLFAWAYELTPEGIKPSNAVELPDSITRETGRKLDFIIIGVLVLAVVFMVIDNYVLVDEPIERTADLTVPVSPGVTDPAVPEDQPVLPELLPNSVAVLPFENLSPDPDDAYFAAGLHEEVLNYLAKLRALNVIARTSMMRYANSEKSIPEIAAELNVETVMEGSVRYANNRVRVTTQLIDSRTESHLWSEAYERDFDDIFAIQADIAMNVANALNAAFSDEEQQSLETPPTHSSAAYALYLKNNPSSEVGATSAGAAIAGLDRALEIDPDFTLAHGAKAWFYAQGLINTATGTASEWETNELLVRESAYLALTGDPFNIVANTALVNIDLFAWRWAEAMEIYDRFYEKTGIPLGYNAWIYAWAGQPTRAIEISQYSLNLNPADWSSHWMLGWAYLYSKDFDSAADAFRQATRMAPANPLTHSLLATAQAGRRNIEGARESLRLTEQLLGENRPLIFLLDLAYNYDLIGFNGDSDRIIQEIQQRAEAEDIGTGGWALLSLTKGDEASALEWLEAGVSNARSKTPDPSLFTLMNLKMNYNNNPVLEKPEFVALREQLTGL